VITAWSVPAGQASSYSLVANKLSQNLLTIWARERYGKLRPPEGSRRTDIVWIIIVVLLAIGALAGKLLQR